MDRLIVALFAVLALQMGLMASGGASADYADNRPITLAQLCP